MTIPVLSPSFNLKQVENICLFGVGTYFKDCFAQICLVLGKKPELLADNDESKWGSSLFGIKCVSPDTLTGMANDLVVVITVRQYESIYEQLKQLGIKHILVMNFERGHSHIAGLYELTDKNDIPRVEVDTNLLKGKWALVTGASRGIGFQIATSLAGLGVNLLAHSRDKSHNQEVVRQCLAKNVEVISVEADLVDSNQIERMLHGLPEIDILINSAGISLACDDYWKTSPIDFIETLKVNTIAPVILSNALIPKMISQGYGRVVNVSSTIQYRPYEMAYACSKAALDKYVHDISPTLDGTGVKMSLLDPGWLKTDMGGENATHDVESVLPGALLGVVMDDFENGRWFSAQDFAGQDLESAIAKVNRMSSKSELMTGC
jgi:short-subunit dehydrogenase